MAGKARADVIADLLESTWHEFQHAILSGLDLFFACARYLGSDLVTLARDCIACLAISLHIFASYKVGDFAASAELWLEFSDTNLMPLVTVREN